MLYIQAIKAIQDLLEKRVNQVGVQNSMASHLVATVGQIGNKGNNGLPGPKGSSGLKGDKGDIGPKGSCIATYLCSYLANLV